jgi:hypothetical protein
MLLEAVVILMPLVRHASVCQQLSLVYFLRRVPICIGRTNTLVYSRQQACQLKRDLTNNIFSGHADECQHLSLSFLCLFLEKGADLHRQERGVVTPLACIVYTTTPCSIERGTYTSATQQKLNSSNQAGNINQLIIKPATS